MDVMRIKKLAAGFGAWNEEDHPRDENGKFASAGGGKSTGVPAKAVKAMSKVHAQYRGVVKAVRDRMKKTGGKDVKALSEHQLAAMKMRDQSLKMLEDQYIPSGINTGWKKSPEIPPSKMPAMKWRK